MDLAAFLSDSPVKLKTFCRIIFNSDLERSPFFNKLEIVFLKSFTLHIASAKLFDQENNLIGKGRGIYRRSKQQLNQINNYQ